MKKGARTREKILDLAEVAILERGFAGTSIDTLIEEAGITKGGFFYHFKDKNELIHDLLKRYFVKDDVFFQSLFDQADELSEDPLTRFLIMLKLMAKAMAELPDTHPGCIVASVVYQNRIFNKEVREMNQKGVLLWHDMFLNRLKEIRSIYQPKSEIDIEALAHSILTIVEGGIVVSRAVEDKMVLSNQILIIRDYIRLLFTPVNQLH